MKIKTKLALGIAFLFGLFGLVGGLGGYFIHLLSARSNEIIKDNYESVEYTKEMLRALDEIKDYHTLLFFSSDSDSLTRHTRRQLYRQHVSRFEQNLRAEAANITENGEGQMVRSLEESYYQLKRMTENLPAPQPDAFYFNQLLPLLKEIQRDIFQIKEVNLQAINRKNAAAQQTAKEVLTTLSLIGVVAFIAFFTFLINFPGYIANPIQELARGIHQIANKNYEQRLHFSSNDEFGEVAAAFNSMARKLDEYEHSNLAKILFDKKRLDTVINSMRDAIIGLDESLRILFINQEASKLMALDAEAVVGKYAPDVALSNDLMRNLLQGVMVPEKAGEEPTLKIVVDGKEAFFSKEVMDVVFTRTGEKTSRKIGYVIALKDITRFQELDAAKTNFIATISHELKTPISSINMSLKLLEDERIGAVNEKQQQLLSAIKTGSQRLLKITGELLDLSQVESGQIQLRYELTKPGDIIHQAHEALRLQAERKNIGVEIQLPDHLPELTIDRDKTTWVLVNLLSNAIRYSPEGGKIILAATGYAGEVTFSVQDFGKGIAPQYQQRIFERYFRVPENGSPSYGTGLGLAISKEFITAQGGEIRVDSQPGQGSTFRFTLPIKKQA